MFFSRLLGNPFNLRTQRGANWTNRAAVAADLIIRHAPTNPIIADVGCGDQKLQRALGGFPCTYRGYDLNPQSRSVTRLDVLIDQLPECDLTALLGVLEYVPVAQVLAKARSRAIVVSHLFPDYGAFSPALVRKRRWTSLLSKSEFELVLSQTGFSVRECVRTPEGKQHVWFAERPDAVAPSIDVSTRSM
jgi:hypothetical protein